ncbi:MAG: prepilin-type N-terminal cleavage/methylation protein [Glaciihabitans sp.]|jgi:prepilin-type N-terminal cleavage/methylation domain-containing protein|nr:prepilin-type N-terminal cleavage/methylation protein [Glaciihabitans sp.]
MNRIRRSLNRAASDESGLSLIEVIVAIMVFAIISTAVAYTMTAVLSLTADTQSRAQATSLAAQELDLDRSITDLFDLTDATRNVTVNGTTYHIYRKTQWVSDPTIDQKCGIGGGVLKYKRVNVTVGWDGMRSSTPSVRADTLIDPGTRINDPTRGTILVSVLNAAGTGSAGVTVTATPSAVPNGATALTATPDATDADGCSYILSVVPGNYDVTISKTGYLDTNQSAISARTVGVVAGGAASVGPLQFDRSGRFTLTYASNVSGAPMIAQDLDVSFVSTYPTYTATTPVSNVNLYPFTGGYNIIAGAYGDSSAPATVCLANDPGAWPAGKGASGADVSAGVRALPAATVPGGTVAANVEMGGVKLNNVAKDSYVTAIQVVGPSKFGDPGCSAGALQTYRFGKAPVSNPVVALPYGSWKIFSGGSFGSTSNRVQASDMAVQGAGGTDSSNGDIAILDPRKP